MDEQITIDIEGYSAGEGEPDCITELFDLQGRELSCIGGNE